MKTVQDDFFKLCHFILKHGSGTYTGVGEIPGMMVFDITITGRLDFDPSESLPSPVWAWWIEKKVEKYG